MRTRALRSAILICISTATPLLAQHQHPAATPSASMANMLCGGDMAMMHGMMGMMHGMPGGQGMPGMRMDSMKRRVPDDSMKAGMPMEGAMRGMPKMDMSAMMEMMGPPAPAMILEHKDKLGLSTQQVSRLQALQNEAQPVCMHHMEAAMTAHHAAVQLLDAAAPDFTAFSAKLKEATGHMAEGHVALAKAAVAARQVLTPAQRQTLKDDMAQMHKQMQMPRRP